MSEKGYDYQLVGPGATDAQKCPVCELIVRNAYKVFCCDRRLCRSCLFQLSSDVPCPQCNQVISGYRNDPDSDREIQSLTVFCRFKSVGCDWTGELIHAYSHIEDCKNIEQFVLLRR